MITIRGINIKDCPFYFFTSMTNIKNFNPNFVNVNKTSFEKNTNCDIYEIQYFKQFDSKNFLYLIFNNVGAYIKFNPTEDDSETKYLVFPFKDKNREALENYTQLWGEIKDKIETINGGNLIESGKNFMKARFESNDDLPLNKILNIPVCIITVNSVFQAGNNSYTQVSLYEESSYPL